MFGLFGWVSKRDFLKEIKKVKDSFFLRDYWINKNIDDVAGLKTISESNKERIARLEGVIAVLVSNSHKSQMSQSPKVSNTPTKSHTPPRLVETIEAKMINKIRRNKKALVVAEINRLLSTRPEMDVVELYEEIVVSKGLCSKASFYRYVKTPSCLLSQRGIPVETCETIETTTH